MAESHFLPTVTLFDWWLVKSPENHLSISGISSRKGEAVRVFNSSPIVIRYDETYLETADGISILIRGIIDKERTLENGFTPEIFKSFYFSFPPNWESRALDCFREEAEHVTDSVNAVTDTVSATCEDISSEGEQNSIPVSLVLPEEALGDRKEPFAAEERNDSKETSRCDVVYCSTGLHDIKVCQQKQQQPASGCSLRHPDKEQSSFSKALENHDLDADVLDDVSENVPEISSDAVENSFPTLVSPEKAVRDCKQFVEDEHDISIKMSEVNIVQCDVKVYPRKQPTTGGPSKHPDEDQISDSVNAVMDTVSATRDILSNDEEKPISNLSELPEEAQENNQTPFPGDECEVLKEMSGVNVDSGSVGHCNKLFLEGEEDMSINTSEANVVHGSGGNRRSARLHNVKSFQKKQPATGSLATRLDEEKPISILSELPEEAQENNQTPFPGDECEVLKDMSGVNVASGSVGHCNKLFLEGAEDMSNNTSEANVIHGSGGSRRSARLHNVKSFQKKQPATGSPATRLGEQNPIPVSLVLPEEALGNRKEPFAAEECNDSKETSRCDVVYCSTGLHDIKVCQQKQQQPTSGGSLRHPDKEQSSFSKALENHDLDADVLDNVSENVPEISSDAVENSFPTLVSPEKAARDCKQFVEDEHDISIKMNEVNIVQCNVKVYPRKQPTTGGPSKHPDEDQISDSVNAVMDTVSATCEDILSNDEEKPISNLSELPEEAQENNQTPFPGDECEVLKDMSGVNVASGSVGHCNKLFLEGAEDMSNNTSEANVIHGSGGSRRSARLHNVKSFQKKQPATGSPATRLGEQNPIPVSLVLPEEALGNRKEPFAAEECNDSKETSRCDVVYCSTGLHDIKVCQQKQQQPTSGGSLRHPDKEQSSFSKALENHDLDADVLDNVSENVPEISSDAVEKSFPTLVSPEKAARDCKQFIEDEHDISIKMSEVNIVQCTVGNRRSARLRNVKVYPRKHPTTVGPPKHPDEDQISASTSLEKSEEGQKSPLTPIESQSKRLLNSFSEQVVNKFTSRVSETLSAKTERCYKKKMVSIEIEAVRPKRKSPHVRDVSHLNQGSKQSVSLESLSLKKSKYGEENSIPVSLVLPEEALENRKEPFVAEECNDSKETSRCDVVYCSTGLHDIKVCQQKQQQPTSGGSLRHPDKEQSYFSKALENHDFNTVFLDNVSENFPEISSDVEKSFPTLVSPEKAARDCKQFVEDEHDISIKMSEVNIVQWSVGNKRSARLRNVKVYPRKQPTTGGPSKHPDEDQISDSVNAVMDTVSATCEDISSDVADKEKSISILLELPEAQENNKTPFPGDEEGLKEMSGVNVASGSVGNIRSTRLHNINVCQPKNIKKQKQQPRSRGRPLKHSHEEPSSTSKAVENCDLDTAHLDNVSVNLPEISRGAVENSFPTSSVTPEKATGHCNKLFLEGEEDMSIKTGEANVVHGSGGNRHSAPPRSRGRPLKQKPKQQPRSRGRPLKHSHEEPSSTSKAVENCDLDTAHLDNISSNLPEISSGAVENSFPTSFVTPEKATGHCNKLFLEGEEDMSIKTGEVNVVHGSGGNRHTAWLPRSRGRPPKQKQQSRSRGRPLKHSHEEPSSTSKAVESCDLDTAHLDNVSANLPEVSRGAVENSFPTSSVTPEKATGHCNKLFLEGEEDMSIKTGEANVVHGSGGNRHSAQLPRSRGRPLKQKQKQQPRSRGRYFKHSHEEPSSTSKAVENCDLDTAHLDNVSANLPEVSRGAVENSFPTSSVTPEKATGHCNKLFLEGEEDMSIKTGEANVVHGSGGNRHSAQLPRSRGRPLKQKQKQQPRSRGRPLKHSHEEPSSTSKAVENCDLGAAHLDNVSANLPEISRGAVENSFPISVTPEKATGHCNKLFLEGEEDMSIKTGEASVVHGSGGNRHSARMYNVKSFQKKQPATGSPVTCLGKDTTTIEKSDGGLENLSTPVQSQNGIVNKLSRQVTNKLISKISQTSLAKTEVGHKRKRVIGETEAVTPKRKVMKLSFSVKSPQGRDVSDLNKGSEQGLSIVSPESLSLKKSRSGRLLLPSLEFWHNEIPIYNADRGIKEIQQDLNLTSPFRVFSPSPGRL